MPIAFSATFLLHVSDIYTITVTSGIYTITVLSVIWTNSYILAAHGSHFVFPDACTLHFRCEIFQTHLDTKTSPILDRMGVLNTLAFFQLALPYSQHLSVLGQC